ncbi:hypothetical protein [Nostoc sp.]
MSKFKTAFRKFPRRHADLLMTMFISSILSAIANIVAAVFKVKRRRSPS